MPPRHLRFGALGIALVLCVCIVGAAVVPMGGMLSVRAGQGFNIALRPGGTVWTWGDNGLGQLGNGTTNPSLTPAPVVCGEAAGDPNHCSADGYLTNGVKVAAGMGAAAVLLDNGAVLVWGLNSTFSVYPANVTTPVYVRCGAADAAHCAGGLITGAAQIAVGFSHYLILLDDGAVLAWGTNNNGNLGNNQPAVPSAVPVQVSTLTAGSGVITIAAGQNHSFALKSDGTVAAWGNNQAGQIGDDTTALKATPVSVLCRLGDVPGSAFCSSANVLQGAIAVSAGSAMSLALLSDHTLLGWGGNTSGQAGDGTTVQRRRPVSVCAVGATVPCQVASGNTLQGVASLGGSSLATAGYAVMTNGSVLAWGSNSNGQLGDGTTTSRSLPALVSGFGAGSGVTAISPGDAHAMGTMSDGTARAWGANTNGQLGNGSISASTSPVSPFGLGSGSGVIAIASRAQFTLALRADGTVLAWGGNGNGQLGDGTLNNRNIPVNVVCREGDAPGSTFCSADGYLQGVLALATGFSNYSMALMNDGSVLAWGNNSNGQLGDGTTTQRNRPVNVCSVGAAIPCSPAIGNILLSVTSIAGAGTTSYARTLAGGIVSWGNNPNGLLGIGSATPASSPTPLNVVCRAGDSIGSTFCSSAGFLQGVSTISAGNNMPFAIMADSTVLGWGLNLVNQLGDGTQTNRNRPVNVCAVGATEPCTVAGGNVLQGIAAVAGAANSAFALTSTGLVLGWGANANTLGDGTTLNRSTPVNVCAVGASPTCSVANGNVLQGVSTIAAGVNSGYAVLNDGTVVGWGANSSGNLGDGTLSSRPTPVIVSGLGPGSGVIAVSAGAGSAVALRSDGSVFAWGANGVGELGDGTVFTENLTPAPVVIDDVTPPTLTFGTPVPATPNGANGWYTTDVSIPWAAADAHSALSATNPSSPLVLSAEGFAVNGSTAVCDIAENCATFWSAVVKIDKTAPQATVTATPNRLWPPNNQQVPVQILVTASDSLELPSQPVSALTITSNEPGSSAVVVQPAVFVLSGSASGSSNTNVQLVASKSMGQPRTYTITGTVQDAAGHATPFTVTVTVAKAQ